MKNFKKLIMVGAMVTMIGAASVTAFAASSYSTPAEAVAGLTGKTVEDVTAERYETGKTYGTIANDAGKLEEFQTEMLQIKKDILADRVEAGLMTQERADEIIAAIENNQSACDGTGSLRTGQRMGAGFGSMNGGQGYGQGNGQGMRGFGQGGGFCQAQ
ncbi:DUF2680 domain-containing protein [Sinanaerobacter chloroacetimidivorans]|uniref:DUF2680 domain-containing protein n=1 Tax=Sinanaerobacter chloroacetimidivorans TaxID=2818044 RepID=A0A8J7W0E8_9FIRM|nr:DUF2680 domain-containing protein [Sinanaerobacter chloroacetimidivorans]MBR0598484.1 DUF2680 domain-containing protein [Sinanaerobacter chloroacetimidivorans]